MLDHHDWPRNLFNRDECKLRPKKRGRGAISSALPLPKKRVRDLATVACMPISMNSTHATASTAGQGWGSRGCCRTARRIVIVVTYTHWAGRCRLQGPRGYRHFLHIMRFFRLSRVFRHRKNENHFDIFSKFFKYFYISRNNATIVQFLHTGYL